jgi:DNA-binding NarL/FixJ family response regulator
VKVVQGDKRADADVLVAVAERLSHDMIGGLRQAASHGGRPVVLIANEITEAELLTAVACGVVAILPAAAATGDRVLHSVLAAAAGGAVMPPNLVGELLQQIDRLQREVPTLNGLTAAGLSRREVDVLRLTADGLDTAEIAAELCYSERTVKNIIYGLTQRLKLRNRSHAVAYALRSGLI